PAMIFLALVAMSVRGISAQNSEDTQIDMSRVVTMSIAPPNQKYPAPDDRMRLFARIQEELHQIPSVSVSTVTSAVPFGGGATRQLLIEGREPVKAESGQA